ncbi:phosphatase PAP2 family protein [Runella aurantiaca]|uniref:Phosphatase PAP2 family protein n=1 Tax=Runella aurantiaca TaxID=2282308 RepID=A0A369IBX7_9BACT|nr:phosphatase PAP2 family protein [Runella aurantiaca]RDB04704.1 phosphatase PAP2 family protein [Runella aurantiaca]
MLHQIQEIDTRIFLTLNGLHTPWADTIMYWVTQRNTWIPLYALLIVWLIWKYNQRAAGMIGALILTIIIADQTASGLLKPFFERLRPCHVLYLQDKLHLVVEDCGGRYGFASSHAANSFGLAMALYLLVGKKYPWTTWFFFPWAVAVSYSRIYVGVHYPFDVVVGACIGAAAAWIAVKSVERILRLRKKPA